MNLYDTLFSSALTEQGGGGGSDFAYPTVSVTINEDATDMSLSSDWTLAQITEALGEPVILDELGGYPINSLGAVAHISPNVYGVDVSHGCDFMYQAVQNSDPVEYKVSLTLINITYDVGENGELTPQV